MKLRAPTLADVALVCVLAITSWSEYHFGTRVLGLPWWLALCVPGAVDCYVVAAMRARQDIGCALTLLIVSVFGSTASHLVQLDSTVKVVAAGGFVSVLGIVLWRVHVLLDAAHEQQDAVARAEDQAAAAAQLQREAEQRLAEAHARADERETRLAEVLARNTALVEEVAELRKQAPRAPERTRQERPETTPRRRAADHRQEAVRILRGVLAQAPDAGRPRLGAALREAGLSAGNDLVEDLAAEARRPHAVGETR
jgi:hypothetical protein